MLIHSPLLRYVKEGPLSEQYNYLKRNVEWDRYMLDDPSVFNISYAQGDMRKLTRWVNRNIVLRLGECEFESPAMYNVLLRIATGMLNKLDLPKDTKLRMHECMTKNIHMELDNIIMESLPF